MAKKDLDWGNLGFTYMKTNKRFVANYKDGKWDDGAIPSDVMAFYFDNTNVKNEQTALGEIWNKEIQPVICGYVSYDEAHDKIAQELKDAGMDKYLAEVQKQLDEYFKTEGK